MHIEVRLFATLRKGRFKRETFEYESSTPAYILSQLNIPHEDVAILLVNGRDGSFDQPLNDGDTVSIFPPVGGG
jgi:molybdopterin converting factor small subunit